MCSESLKRTWKHNLFDDFWDTPKCDKTMCCRMVTSCGMQIMSMCSAGAMYNANTNTTNNNPYGVASVWSSTSMYVCMHVCMYACVHVMHVWAGAGRCRAVRLWKVHPVAGRCRSVPGRCRAVPWGWEFWYLPTIVHGNFDIFLPLYSHKGLSEVPRGWDFWYLLTIVHTQGQFEVPRGWKFDIFLPLYTFKVNLKFHGGGNFDIFWTLQTLKGQFEVTPMGVRIFWYLLPTIVHTQRWIWSSMGVEFDIVLLVHTLNVNLKFHGGGNFDVFLITIAPTQRSIWRSMGVEILVSSYHCTHSRSIWSSTGVEIWYLLTLVHIQGQFEVPWGWEFWYLLNIANTQRSIWSYSHGCENFLISSSDHCTHSKVNLKFHGGGIWYRLTGAHTQCQFEVPWGWEFRRLLNYHCTHAKVNLKVHGGGNFGIFLPFYKLKVNLKFHGGGNFVIFRPLHTQRSIWSSMGVGNLISSYWCTHSMSIWRSTGGGKFYIPLPLYTLKGLSAWQTGRKPELISLNYIPPC